ncbi:MAG: hypothetical protein Q9221_006863 [Calogaya cf. arnoldii]
MLREMLIFSDIKDKILQLNEDSTGFRVDSASYPSRATKLYAEAEAVFLVDKMLSLVSQDEEETSHFQRMFARQYEDRYLVLAPYVLFGGIDGITALTPFFSTKMFRTSEHMVALVEIVNLLKPEFSRTEELQIYAQAINRLLNGQRLTDKELDQIETYSSEVQCTARSAEGHRINAATYLATLRDSSQTMNGVQPSPPTPTSGSVAADNPPANVDQAEASVELGNSFRRTGQRPADYGTPSAPPFSPLTVRTSRNQRWRPEPVSPSPSTSRPIGANRLPEQANQFGAPNQPEQTPRIPSCRYHNSLLHHPARSPQLLLLEMEVHQKHQTSEFNVRRLQRPAITEDGFFTPET